jgi:biopolymer transport protein ExbD
MKKSYKPMILVLLILLVSTTAIILLSIGIRLKYEELTRQKVRLEKELSIENTIRIKLLADHQMYADENIIETFAKENLGMIKRDKPALIIKINQDNVEKLNRELISDYE